MNDIFTRADESPSLDSIWQRRLDALVRGECSEDDFMAQLSSLRQANADSAWSVVALLDQRYRRGQMPLELFRSIEAKIARRELGALDYGTTIELEVLIEPSGAVRDMSPIDTIEILTANDPILSAVAAAMPSREPPSKLPAAPAQAARTPHGRGVERVLRNRYVLEDRLGTGGRGTVFKAQDRYRCDLPQANRLVAIKFLREEADCPPEILANLRREFYCAQALSHPNIVKVYELDRDGDAEFFTMEFVDGELLSGVIEQLGSVPLSRPRAWTIIREVAAGLAHAHARGVIHADLKPRNIMITGSGEVRMLGFGASNAEAVRRNDSEASAPAYASCELLEGQSADPRDDVFALACMSYKLLAGRHPFEGRPSTEARELGLAARRPTGLARRQWRALQQGLAWRREDSPASVADWVARMQPGPQVPWALAKPLAIALLAFLVIGGAMTLLNHRSPLDSKDIGDGAAPSAVHVPDAASEPAVSPVEPEAQPVRQAAAAIDKPDEARPPRAPPRDTSAVRTATAAVKAHPDTLSISAATYRVGAHKNFAEIHVRRSFGSGADTSFAWWTEPATAMPDTDYVPQAKAIQPMSKQNQMARLFVKLVPNVSRNHSVVFNVVIAEPGVGASLGRITRTAVILPPQ